MKFYCKYCGGTEVYFDAYVNANDAFDILYFDNKYCATCDGETQVEYR